VPLKGEQRKALLRRLTEAFGQDRVLTACEDLYIYSHHSRFGTRRIQRPLAVLRLRSEDDERRLRGIVDSRGVAVVRDSMRGGEEAALRQDEDVIIVDSGGYLAAESLPERLSGLAEAEREKEGKLRASPSFPHRFVSLLQSRDGYRLEELGDSDDGFCVMQPFFDGLETYSAKGRLILSRGLFRGDLAANERLVDSMYSCSSCGQCYDQLAKGGFEVNDAIVRARREIVKLGAEPRQSGLLRRNMAEYGNPLGMPPGDRTLWFEEVSEEFPYRRGDMLYWAGCSTAYRLPNVVVSTTNVLRKSGVGFGMLGGEEGCCGLILYLLGLWDEAAVNASANVEKLTKLGVKQIVTSCAGCYFAFTRVYAMLGVEMPFEVLHSSQMMDFLIRGRRLRLKAMEGSYVWHDPCDLGRHCGVYEPPRRVLRSIPGLRLLEPPLTGSHALCCGGGGGLWMYNKDLAEKVTRMKLGEQLGPLGADGIVTGCPNCMLIMKYAAGPGSEKSILDLSEIVDRCVDKS
jgi:Fe-S oxidoreductase